MPPIPKKGQIIHGYRILEHLNKGAMANAFAAADTHNGYLKVFFKAYISPTPALDWYHDYVDYVEEINKRLEHPTVRQFCVKTTDQFQEAPSPKSPNKFFFQVFEFIEGGHDLESLMEKAKKKPELMPWEIRLTMAKVFLAGLKNLHAVKIVHADLKPANIQMLPDSSTKIGFKPRLIDMDFSLMDDQLAPWDGKVGYVGTPGYYSPEHLKKAPGKNIPRLYSDMFTCGIILCELLAGKHPFAGKYEDIEEYKRLVETGDHHFSSSALELMGKVNDSDEKTAILADTILACLSPEPSKRPTAEMLHKALLGRLEEGATIHSATESKPESGDAGKIPAPAATTPGVMIKGDIGQVRYGVTGVVGRSNLGSVSSDAQYASHDQFKLTFEGGEWQISPCPDATNHTLVNGSILEEAQTLSGETAVMLQSRSSDRTAMPLTLTMQ